MRREKVYHYILFYKPYGVLCQFTDSLGRATLADYGNFPKDVYPVGRLDADSEGLVLLSDDGAVKHLLLEPAYHHPRTYLVQVEHTPSAESLEKLRHGVIIEKKITLSAEVQLLRAAPNLPPRSVPVRFRKKVPTAWLEMTLFEGRNRQVRKMTAAVGHPTLRLLRTKIGNLSLKKLAPGKFRKLTPQEIQQLRASTRIHIKDHKI